MSPKSPISRREALRLSGALAVAPILPQWLFHPRHANTPSADGRVLVVIQLDGGNDGLNTVVPFRDEEYLRLRPKVRLDGDSLLPLTDDLKLHASLRSMRERYDKGQITIVQNVGYPRPDRSHFRSMQIWATARREDARIANGWLASAIDPCPRPSDGGADILHIGTEAPPRAVIGRRAIVASVAPNENYDLTQPLPDPKAAAASPLEEVVRRRTAQARDVAELLAEVSASMESDDDDRPTASLRDRLMLVHRLLRRGTAARAYYTRTGDYDTHALQLPTHAANLAQLSFAINSFLQALEKDNLQDRVAILIFSEFGRRVAENGSAGTDHGAAGPVFLVGAPLVGGLIGEAPDLRDLDDGDVRMKIDFRRIYATLLEDWLQLPSKQALGGRFETLPLFA